MFLLCLSLWPATQRHAVANHSVYPVLAKAGYRGTLATALHISCLLYAFSKHYAALKIYIY